MGLGLPIFIAAGARRLRHLREPEKAVQQARKQKAERRRRGRVVGKR